MTALKKELKERKIKLQEKIDFDTAIYGKPLVSKTLQDKIDATKRKIIRHQESMDKYEEKLKAQNEKKHKLSAWDRKVLNTIRSNDPSVNTTSESSYRYDHRYTGSARTRRQARRYFRS